MEEPNRALQSAPAVKTRLPYLDALRVISFIAVVVIHVCAPRFFQMPLDSAGWLVNTTFNSVARFAVPVFFMVSGVLWLDPNRPFSFKRMLKKNVLRLLTAYVFWRFIYLLVSGEWREWPELLHRVKSFILGMIWRGDHLWFIPALIVVYLFVPLLRKIAADRKLLSYYVLLWAVFGTVGYTLYKTELLPETLMQMAESLQPFFALGYTGYFMLGYWLSSAQVKIRGRILLYFLGILGVAGIFALTVLYVGNSGKRIELWFDYLTPFCALETAAVFIAVQSSLSKRPPAPRRRARLAALGELSFGAYCVHLLFILPFQFELIPSLADLGVPYVIEIPVFALAVAVLSFAASWLLHQVPFCKSYLV